MANGDHRDYQRLERLWDRLGEANEVPAQSPSQTCRQIPGIATRLYRESVHFIIKPTRSSEPVHVYSLSGLSGKRWTRDQLELFLRSQCV